MGYRMVLYPIATSIAAVGAVDRMLARLADSGSLDLAAGELQAGRQLIEDTIGLDEQYALERATVEEAVV
jgi:hypothetical protein